MHSWEIKVFKTTNKFLIFYDEHMKRLIQSTLSILIGLTSLGFLWAQNTPTVVVEIPRPQGYKNLNIPGPTSIQAKVDNTI